METSTLTSLLGETWFGANLPVTARARLAAVGTVVQLREGTVVIREGQPCEAMGIVLDGRVALRLGIPPSHPRTILTIDRGDVFGWSAALPGTPASSTCVAATPCRAILFEAFGLCAALEADPELAAAVYRQLLACVARRLATTRLQLLDLYGSGAESRR
ncbi:MAG TPA: cyclic nucleotide-binding domain-containing protein [Candidatus Limnocylindrales bacterium]|nr:cyclic nucleotide-binding domain-containing protein [Candidatus Limnocylindrales bacterium]